MIVADFEKFLLQPGVDLYVHPTKKFKTIVIKVYVHRMLGPEDTKVALLPFVLRRGCRRFPTHRRIVEFLEELYGASFTADVLKIGERQILYFRMEVVNDRFAPKKVRALRTALEFLHLLIAHPVREGKGLRREYVEQEKENLDRLIRSVINDRMGYAVERCIQEMCRGEIYARYEYGRRGDLPRIRAPDLAEIHGRMISRSPIEIYLVGDVRPEAAAETAAKIMDFGKRDPELLPPTAVRSGGGEVREVEEAFDVDQGKLVLGARHGITWSHDDVFPLVFYNGLLGGFPHSKLFVNVREREGLAYSAHSSLDYTKGLLFIQAGIDPGKYRDCLRLIREQMEEVAQGRFGEQEVEKTRYLLADRVRSREDSGTAKIGAFAEMIANGRPLAPEEIIARLNAVTREDILRVAPRIHLETVYFLRKDGARAEGGS